MLSTARDNFIRMRLLEVPPVSDSFVTLLKRKKKNSSAGRNQEVEKRKANRNVTVVTTSPTARML